MKIIMRSFIILICTAYFFVFGRRLPSEITYIPLWVKDLNKADMVVRDGERIPESFRLNGKFGYLYDDGKITYIEDLLYGVAADDNGFIGYSRQNNVLVIRGIDGQFLNTIKITGYPFFSGDRRFVISYDSNSISEIDSIGSVLWKKTFSSTITEVSASPSLVFIGTVDGKFRLIDPAGSVVFFHATKTSRINVVYGGSVSENGDYILTVSGIDTQLLSLWSRNGDDFRIESTWRIDPELRRHTSIGFSDDGLFAYVETEDALLLLELKKNKLNSIKITGRLQYIDFPGAAELIHAVGRDSDGLYLVTVETDGDRLFYTRLAGTDIMLMRDQSRIILGIDSKLIGFDMETM